MKLKKWLAAGVAGAAAIGLLAGCTAGGGSSGKVTIDLWTAQAGSNPVEIKNMQSMLDEFTKQNPQYAFTYKKYPSDSFAKTVQGAAASNSLPCMLAVDAPQAPNWAWAKWLTPLDLPKSLTDELIPGAKGTYDGKIYSVGYWDAGLAIFARKSVLEKHGIRIPTVDDPWTGEEFDRALATLKTDTSFKYPFSIGDPSGVGATYPILPYLWSFGGDMIKRPDYQTAQGALNGSDAVKWGTWLQDLVKKGYTNPATADGNLFETGQVPMIWDGNWDTSSSIEKFGDDVVFLPPPDFGNGIKVGAGSYGYGTTSSCSSDQRKGVNEFLKFSLTTKNLANIAETQGVIPATKAAAAETTLYKPGGRFEIFSQLEAEHSEVRPATPAFPVAGDIFNKAVGNIFSGAPVKATLDQAVKDIDADIEQNQGYGLK